MGTAILSNLKTPQQDNETYKKYRSGNLSLKYSKKIGYNVVEHVQPASDMMPAIVSLWKRTVDTPRPKHYATEVAARRYGRKSLYTGTKKSIWMSGNCDHESATSILNVNSTAVQSCADVQKLNQVHGDVDFADFVSRPLNEKDVSNFLEMERELKKKKWSKH